MTNPTTANLVKLKEITYAHNDVITYSNVQGIFDPAEFSIHTTLQNIQSVLES